MNTTHTPAQLSAFLKGRTDRMDGRPLTCFGDARDDDGELTDAYTLGYDPHDELGLILPQFKDKCAAEVLVYAAEAGVTILRAEQMPRNRCEFPS